ncbi:MAG: outer membrane beta-barrel protein [Vicinamibacterales bacterium]
MTKGSAVASLVCALLAIPGVASAQGSTGSALLSGVEVTPYVALGSSTSWGAGGAVRWPVVGDLSLELDTSYRHAEIGALNASVNLLYDVVTVGRVTPYVAAGVGLDQYGTPEVTGAGVLSRARTGVAVNAGGGVRVRADENWGVRADARWVNGLGSRSGERWRVYNGVTFKPRGR